jgi:hypothetical protein
MAWGVYDYPEPPAVTVNDLWRMRHGYFDEEEEYGDAEEEADD